MHRMKAKHGGFWPRIALATFATLAAPARLSSAADTADGAAKPPAAARRTLRVCADPNNLPFSNERKEGFENRMASLLARELDADLEYTWWAQSRGFFRNTIKAGRCDVVMGVPKELELIDTTDVVYRSSYVFVSRAVSARTLGSLDDPGLHHLKIGVHLIGDDYTNTPPVHALAARGVINNLVGYRIAPDYAAPNPPARLIEAVASGVVDVAIAWGPLAGYFAERQTVPLRIQRITGGLESGPPMTYAIAFGLRRGEPAFKQELNRFISRHRERLISVLRAYRVPLEPEHD